MRKQHINQAIEWLMQMKLVISHQILDFDSDASIIFTLFKI